MAFKTYSITKKYSDKNGKSYLYFENDTNATQTVTFSKGYYAPSRTFYKSSDQITWTEVSSDITLNPGGKVYLKSVGYTFRQNSSTQVAEDYIWNISGFSKIGGNIFSLALGDDFLSPAPEGYNYQFACLFSGNTTLTSAENLVLPHPIGVRCYEYLFAGCTNMRTAPEIRQNSSALNDYSYSRLFENCSSLIASPELKATTLGNYCYMRMFYQCSSLTTAPSILPATTLTDGCYSNMFSYDSLLANAPILPATTLTSSCYNEMFYGCNSVNSVTCLATSKTATGCTNNWLGYVSDTGTFYKNPNTTWGTGANAVPSGWTVQNYQG